MESREREKGDWKEKRENGEHVEVEFFWREKGNNFLGLILLTNCESTLVFVFILIKK